jgi:hypothetical protein
MEKRLLNLELVVEQNTKLIERLDRSMQELKQSFAELRLHVDHKFAEFRIEMIHSHIELRKEMDAKHVETRRELDAKYEKSEEKFAASQAEFFKMVERKFFWMITFHFGALLTLVGYLGKHFVDAYY